MPTSHSELGVMLCAQGLVTGYGKRQIINGVSLSIHEGEVAALIGHNGSGKSTLLKVLFHLLPLWQGSVKLAGKDIASADQLSLLRSGMVYVPQGNRVFAGLTVHENLLMADVVERQKLAIKDGIDRAMTIFPTLKLRLKQPAGTLSGGEKQMLSLARALVIAPRLLLLDEPTLGLAPTLVSGTLALIKRISKDYGAAVLVVEQRVREVIVIAETVHVLRQGMLVFSGPAEQLKDEQMLRAVYI